MERSSPKPLAGGLAITLTGVALVVVAVVLLGAIINLWSAVDVPADQTATARDVTLGLGAFSLALTKATGLLVLSVAAGALGSYVHVATSFASFVGNRRLRTSWLWWYAIRILVGGALALIVYLAVRAGLVTGSSAALDPYGTAAVSGLIGLFSKQAVDKLEDVFATVFGSETSGGDQGRTDKLEATSERN